MAAKAPKAPKTKQLQLPGADKKPVVTRFPPEPSGYLHIGHAKAALLNDYFAHEQYPGGTLILRFDDTNVEKEKTEYQDAILQDVALLGIKPDKISYTSDYFDQIDKYCTQIIKDGKAYADDTLAETMSAQRMAREASARRDESVEDNLARFELMKSGDPEGRKWCIRAKISFDNVIAALRDPVIFRCPKNPDLPHHRTGDKYKAYPTYQFACPVVDYLEGVTHALRTTEYNEQDIQYKWILKKGLGLEPPNIYQFSKIQFIRTLMSKRKLTKLVDSGVVSGWDDPRMPTVRGIRRRGLTVEGLRRFMVSQGASNRVVSMDWHTIWAENKKIIDLKAARYTAIDKDHIEATIEGVEGDIPRSENHPKHARHPLGDKQVVYSNKLLLEQEDARDLKEGEEITLMNWGNAIVKSITFSDQPAAVSATTNGEAHSSITTQPSPSTLADGVKDLSLTSTPTQSQPAKHCTSLTFTLHLAGDFKLTKKKLTWLSPDQALVPITLVDFDHLISKDKLDDADDWEKFVTPETEFRSEAVADVNVWEVESDEVIQFDRKGYYRCDVKAEKKGGVKGVFFKVPTGK